MNQIALPLFELSGRSRASCGNWRSVFARTGRAYEPTTGDDRSASSCDHTRSVCSIRRDAFDRRRHHRPLQRRTRLRIRAARVAEVDRPRRPQLQLPLCKSGGVYVVPVSETQDRMAFDTIHLEIAHGSSSAFSSLMSLEIIHMKHQYRLYRVLRSPAYAGLAVSERIGEGPTGH